MKKSKILVLIITLALVAACVGCYFVFASNNVKIEFSGNGAFTVSVNGNVGTNGYEGTINNGDTVTLTATDVDNFLYWMDGNKNTIKDTTYTFVAKYDTSLQACFKSTTGSLVVYRNTNLTQQVIASNEYTNASDFTAPLAAGAGKYGYVFQGWNMTVEQVQEKIANKTPYIEVNPVYDAPDNAYTVTVVNGAIENADADNLYANNTRLTLRADTAPEGKKFSHWEDAAGHKFSDRESFDLLVYKSDKFTAVYVDASATVAHEPAIWLELYTVDGVIYSRTQMFLPTGYTSEYGLIYAKSTTPANKVFTLDSVGSSGIKKVSYNAVAAMLANHFSFDTIDASSYVYARAYMTYTNGTVSNTIYSGSEATYAIIEKAVDEGANDDIGGDVFINDDYEGYIPEIDDVIKDNGFMTFIAEADKYVTGATATLKSYYNKSVTDYNSVCNLYASQGYKLYNNTKNTLGAVSSATYYKEDGRLAHVYYSSNEKELNVVTSDTEGANLPDFSDVSGSAAMKVTQVSAMNTGKDSSGGNNVNGMGYVIQLVDGSFIIYDGGYKGSGDADEIYGILNGFAGNTTYHIRAWVITHGHDDHDGAFVTYMDKYGADTKLDCVMVSYVNASDNKGSGNDREAAAAVSAYNKNNNGEAKICHVHTGMVFNFGTSAKMEILIAAEEVYIDGLPYFPQNGQIFTGVGGDVDYNDASIVSRVTKVGGKSMMFLADSSLRGANKMMAMYGNNTYLKSDMCQASHHGLESFTLEAYKKIAASVWFYPVRSSYYSNNPSASAKDGNGNSYTVSSDRHASVRKAIEDLSTTTQMLYREVKTTSSSMWGGTTTVYKYTQHTVDFSNLKVTSEEMLTE